MMFFKRLLAALTAACLLLSCAALAEEETETAETLTMGYVASSGAKLNPFLCNERDLLSVGSLVYESLFELDAGMQPQPLLAETWGVDGKKWTIRLRSGVMFHNGVELVAQDVVDSFNTYVRAGNTNPYYGRLDLIESISASDTFEIEVKGKYPGLITLYALTFPIVQRDTLSANQPMGTGPFWIIRYEEDQYVRLDANPFWWKRQPTVQTVIFRHYWDVGQALEALQTGEIDMFQTRSAGAALTKKLAFSTSLDYTTTTYEMLVPNMNSVMEDLNLRKAVMYAIDYNTLIANVYLDMAQQSEVPVPPASWLYESRSAVYYYSPERAMQYLLDAGWKDLTGDAMMNKVDGGMLKYIDLKIITYNEPSSNVRGNAAEHIAEDLRAVGINATAEIKSRDRVEDDIHDGDYDLALIAINLSEVPDLTPLFTKGGSVNFSKTHSEEMDELIKGTLAAANEQDMKNAYGALETYIVDNLPVMGLCFRTGMVLSTRNTAGLTATREFDAYNGLEFMGN